MRIASRPGLAVCAAAAALFAGLALQTAQARLHLGRPAVLTGWVLLAALVFLAILNSRKRLSMLPLGKASTWFSLHVIVGILAVGLFVLHAGFVWPTGAYEQVLAALFWLTSLSGVLGFVIERTYPQRLSRVDDEIIYERIPAEIARLRAAAEAVVLAATGETGSDILARHYLDSLAWYFRRPRFVLSYLVGADRAEHWLRHELGAVARYLDEREARFAAQLRELGSAKARIDRHYAGQSLLKLWLLVHVPLAAAVMIVTAWHVLLVHIYAL